MGIPADPGANWPRHRAPPLVVCAACAGQFDAGEAMTGDSVSCPLCFEIVQLDGVVTQRRHYRRRSAPPDERFRRRAARRAAPTLLFWVLLAVAAAAVIALPGPVATFFDCVRAAVDPVAR